MKKLVVLLLLLSSFDSSAAGRKRPVEAPTPTPTPTVTSTPRPGVGLDCVECSKSEAVKVAAAEKLINEIKKSECFEKALIGRHMIWTEGKTDREVVTHLQTANLTVPVHYYRGRCSVVGRRFVGADDIYFNRCHHDFYNECDTASNAFHEWSHSLGYGHPFRRTSNRGLTVPYSINFAIDLCCKTSKGFREELEVLPARSPGIVQ